MNLDEAQRSKVAEWIAQGLKLSEIQSRLGTELGLHLTYMEVRLLVDDLKLTPKDPEPAKRADTVLAGAVVPPSAGAPPAPGRPRAAGTKPPPPGRAPGTVSLSVDQITRPGAVVSGKVTFSDGITASWQIDQMGQLGLIAPQPGYRPPDSDGGPFRAALEQELAKLGF